MSGTFICDNGSGFLKLGRPGQNFPECKISSVIGRAMLRYDEIVDGIEIKSEMFGDETVKARAMLELKYPIEEGIVKNWDDMEKLWRYAFTRKLGIQEQDFGASRIMLTEAALNPVDSRRKLAEVMFEAFGFEGMQVGIQAIFALSAEGYQNGLVLDSGDGVTHCIPVYQGFLLRPFVTRINMAGRHITNYLIKLLLLRGYAFNSTADFELVRELKEAACYVSCDLQKDRKIADETTALDKEFALPDGSLVRIGRERFEAPELMFRPDLQQHEFDGVSDLVMNTIQSCDIDVRKALYENIILSGTHAGPHPQAAPPCTPASPRASRTTSRPSTSATSPRARATASRSRSATRTSASTASSSGLASRPACSTSPRTAGSPSSSGTRRASRPSRCPSTDSHLTYSKPIALSLFPSLSFSLGRFLGLLARPQLRGRSFRLAFARCDLSTLVSALGD